jgi:hypothetical protein
VFTHTRRRRCGILPSLRRVKLPAAHLVQRDGVSCGPAVAVVAGALLDPGYRAQLAGPEWFGAEQARVHAAANRLWPRALGTTPWGMATAISRHGVRYGWRRVRPGSARHDDAMADVRRAVTAGRPVALLLGTGRPWVIPRHWVLIVAVDGETLRCYEPSSGEVRTVPTSDVCRGRLTGLGFPRPLVLVLPASLPTEPHSNI